MVSPSVDPKPRNGMVYVDLREHGAGRAAIFAAGEIEIGQTDVLTLPQSAVSVARDGAYQLRNFRVGARQQGAADQSGAGSPAMTNALKFSAASEPTTASWYPEAAFHDRTAIWCAL